MTGLSPQQAYGTAAGTNSQCSATSASALCNAQTNCQGCLALNSAACNWCSTSGSSTAGFCVTSSETCGCVHHQTLGLRIVQRLKALQLVVHKVRMGT
jgi:hypothetical protein